MNWNNKILAAIFFVLLAIWIGKTFISGPSTRSFKSTLVQIDTSQVNKLVLFPKGVDSARIELTRQGGGWTASNGDLEVNAAKERVNSVLGQLVNIPTKQLISKSPDKRMDYEVEEQSGKVVEVYQGNEMTEKIVFGRFNFNPNTRQATSYARLADEDDIYAIDGFMSMSFDTDFNSFRNKNLLNVNKGDIKSLQLTDQGTVVTVNQVADGSWQTSEGIALDSTAMDSYLSGIANLVGRDFADGFSPSSGPDQKLEITADNTIGSLEITAFQRGNDFVLKSASNPAFFASDSTGIYKKMFLDLVEMMQ